MISSFVNHPLGLLAPIATALLVVGSAWRFRSLPASERAWPRNLLLLATSLIAFVGLWIGLTRILSAFEGALASTAPLAYGTRFLFGTIVAVVASVFAISTWLPRPPGPVFRRERTRIAFLSTLVVFLIVGGIALWYWTKWEWLVNAAVAGAYGAAGGLAGSLHVFIRERQEKAGKKR